MLSLLGKRGVTAAGITEEMQFVNSSDEKAEIKEQLLRNGVTEIIYLKVGDLSRSDVAGYHLSGTTNYFGNTAHSSGTMMPIRTISRDLVISCRIDDLNEGYTIWKGSSRRLAQGLLFIGDDSMVTNGVSGLMQEMIDDQLM